MNDAAQALNRMPLYYVAGSWIIALFVYCVGTPTALATLTQTECEFDLAADWEQKCSNPNCRAAWTIGTDNCNSECIVTATVGYTCGASNCNSKVMKDCGSGATQLYPATGCASTNYTYSSTTGKEACPCGSSKFNLWVEQCNPTCGGCNGGDVVDGKVIKCKDCDE